ncbi:MAG: hypothetical protein HQL24_04055 [Candidatus Omnitrophica bacterium]|nr:hypothetical protein [Candidatus Omnitrophota bacterium]
MISEAREFQQVNAMQWLQYLGFCVVTGFAAFLGAYFSKKGEHLATKEDIRQITKDVEFVKGSLQSQLYIHQRRYEKEFEILLTLSKHLVELRDYAQLLMPIVDVQSVREEKIKETRVQRLYEIGKKFYDAVEHAKPFYPEEIYLILKELEKQTLLHSIHFQYGDINDRKCWEKAELNSKLIFDLANKGLEAIRKRVKEWESFKIN